VFFAVFDLKHGPKIICQVPEALVTNSTQLLSSVPPTPASESPPPFFTPTNALFSFDDISKFVIPPPPLCGRLVICTAKNCRIIGFPVQLQGSMYPRNYFTYNICFVFDRGADLSCYEPVVRKLSRVLTACEKESGFLSAPQAPSIVQAVLEQLFEDLNSYSETSIPIDRFNSIELKIFPFYPNPPPVSDWMVPVALISLNKRVEGNWDLTMAKVCL
jgi:nitrogen permease regulator 2-like protein